MKVVLLWLKSENSRFVVVDNLKLANTKYKLLVF